MAAIYQTVTLNWKGENYEVTPTFSLIQSIERKGISLAMLAQRVSSGDVPLSLCADVYADMLNYAGCKTDAESVYQAMFEAEQEIITQAVGMALNAFFPQSESQKEIKSGKKKKQR